MNASVGLHHFPLHIANAFIPAGLATLKGGLDGKMEVSGAASSPLLAGDLSLDSVQVGVPQASLNLRLDNRPIKIKDNRLEFERFNIYTEGATPFTVDGYVDMGNFEAIDVNLGMMARNFELINAKRTKESLVYGKLYVDFSSVVKGSPDALTMRGNMNILGNSDFTYVLKDSPLTVEDKLSETVTFVDFRDTARVDLTQAEPVSLGGMDVLMTLHIDEAVQARVDLNEDGSNYMLLEGGGDLSFQYQPDGNMVLNGRYSLMSGEMKYEMPIIPLKTFHIQSGSYIEWTGDLMNPNLNIKGLGTGARFGGFGRERLAYGEFRCRGEPYEPPGRLGLYLYLRGSRRRDDAERACLEVGGGEEQAGGDDAGDGHVYGGRKHFGRRF